MKRLMILFMLLATGALYAQNVGEIKGKVYDAETGQPLPGANVYVKLGQMPLGTATDMDGRFTLKPLDPGVYDVHVSFIGYNEFIKQAVRVNPNKITFLDTIYLGMGVTIGEVVIEEWKKPLIDVEDPSAKTFTADDMIKTAVVRDPAALISSLSTDVKTDDSGNLYFRGGRPDASVYFVNGVKVTGRIPSYARSAMSSLTVYSGGLPAKYGDATGGVVILETKGYFELYNEWKAREEARKQREEKEKRLKQND